MRRPATAPASEGHHASLLRDLARLDARDAWLLPTNNVDEEGLRALVAAGLAEQRGALRSAAWAAYRITPAGLARLNQLPTPEAR